MSTHTHITNAEMRRPGNLIRHGLFLGLYGFVKHLAIPFSEYLRWMVVRPFAPNIKTTSIADGVALWFPWSIHIGSGSSLNQGTIIDGYGGVTIGQNVRIASYVRINTADHRFSDPDLPISQQGFDVAPVTIGDDVWLGTGVIVGAGVTIGAGSIIGAGSVVTRDIPAYSVAVGIPCRVLRRRGEALESD